MERLARGKRSNIESVIRAELQQAGIPVFCSEETPVDELGVRLRGKIGAFVFQRDWAFWKVRGDLPLAIAQKIHRHPIGREMILFLGPGSGHDPEDRVVYKRDGRRLLPRPKQPISERLMAMLSVGDPHEFVDNPSVGEPFVTEFQIDHQPGLNLFAQILREHRLG